MARRAMRTAWVMVAAGALGVGLAATGGCASGGGADGAGAPPLRDSTPEPDRETMREVQRERPK